MIIWFETRIDNNAKGRLCRANCPALCCVLVDGTATGGGGDTLGRRCSEPATAATAAKRAASATAVKLAAATVKQSAAAVRQGGLRGSERVGVRRVRKAAAADGSSLRAVGAVGGVGQPVGDGSAEAAAATVSGTGHGMGRRERHVI